jgi:osmotically inducible lipoprotein OsmB
MKKIIYSCIASFLLIGLLTSCTNREVGTTTGAVVGGVAGSALTGGSTAGTIAGAVGGGFVGNQMTR